MKNIETIRNIGAFNQNKARLTDGRLEIRLPMTNKDTHFDGVLNKCMDDFIEKHSHLDRRLTVYDVRLVFTCGQYRESTEHKTEYTLMLILWNEEEPETEEIYENISFDFSHDDIQKLNQIVFNGLEKMLFKS